MTTRDLNRRHIRGLLFLWRAGMATRAELENAIGSYAANTIISLEGRALVVYDANRYRLTDAGRNEASILLGQERAS